MYKTIIKNEYSSDINLVLSVINKSGYKIKGSDKIVKSDTATKNIYDNVFSQVMDEFENGPKQVKTEFALQWVNKNIQLDIESMGGRCEVPEPTPCTFAEELIMQFNTNKRIEIDPCTYEFSTVGLNGTKRQMASDEYMSELKAYLQDYNQACKHFWKLKEDGKREYPHKGHTFTGTVNLEPRIAVMNYDFERAARKSIRSKLKFNDCTIDEAIALVKNYVVAMRVPEKVDKFKTLQLQNDYRTIVSYVILHWMWLVKRNLSDDPKTVEQIFVNIFGAQSSGKTTFIENLSNALQYFYAEADVNKVMDPREGRIFANKRIVFFDEFGSKSKLSQDEMTAMKKIITSPTMYQRNMRENTHTELKVKFTGISATNITIGDIVKDESGARRYFEIVTDTAYNKSEVSHFDFDFLDSKKVKEENGKDSYIDIWKVVDDSLDEGYLSMNESVREDIRKIQSTYVPKSSTLQFLTSDKCTYVSSHAIKSYKELKDKVGADGYQKLGITELYKKYLTWCKSNNLEQSKTMQNFKREVEELDILTSTKRKGYNSDMSIKLQNMYYVFSEIEHADDLGEDDEDE